MLWAAAMLCFFGFFRTGEITVPSQTSFDSSQHLAWGDIAIDDRSSPKVLKIHLKKSKCNQLGRGVDVFIGRTDGVLCQTGLYKSPKKHVIRIIDGHVLNESSAREQGDWVTGKGPPTKPFDLS